jgi:hypothetical protein
MVMLTEGLWWPELRRREVVGEVRRRDVVELAEEGRIGVAPGPGLLGSARGAPAAAVEGSA